MSIFVYLAALVAVANTIAMLKPSVAYLHPALFFITALLAALGLWKPGPDKTDGRVVALLAVTMGFLPLLREPIRRLRYTLKERAYAREIAPRQERWLRETRGFADGVDRWAQAQGALPHFAGWNAVRPGETAATPSPDPAAGLSLFQDPFLDGATPVRYWTDSRSLWTLLSNGPDKKTDLKEPPPLRPGDDADWRARWIAMNSEDPLLLTFDPTNGSLGRGDLAVALGDTGATARFLAELSAPWSRARAEISQASAGSNDAQRGAAAAARLLDAGDPAAALAAAQWAVARIPRFLKDQSSADYLGWRLLGEALYTLGDPRMAANALVKYRELNPNDPRGHYYLAAALYAAGDPVQARREFGAAAQIDPDHAITPKAQQAFFALSRGGAPPLPPRSPAPPPSLLRAHPAESPAP